MILLFIWGICSVMCSCQSDPTNKDSTDEPSELVPLEEEYDESAQKWGFIDTNGQVKIRGDYDELGNFSEGMAAFRTKAKWGYLNKSGEEVIPAQYYNAFVFKDGLAKVGNFERKYGMIDAQGKAIIPMQYDDMRSFEEELCAFKQDGKWGYIDIKNEVRLKPKYESAKDFKNGRAIVKEGGKYFLINIIGLRTTDLYDKITLLNNGLLKVKLDKKYGLISPSDKHGGHFVDLQYKNITQSNDQVVAVKKKDAYTLFSLPSTVIPTPKNDKLQCLNENRWAYEVNGKVGILNNKGEIILKPTYNIITPFKNGFASYQSDELWGYLDREGKVLTPPFFGLAWEFSEGLARVIGRQGLGYIDEHGKIVLIADDYDARDFNEGLARMPID